MDDRTHLERLSLAALPSRHDDEDESKMTRAGRHVLHKTFIAIAARDSLPRLFPLSYLPLQKSRHMRIAFPATAVAALMSTAVNSVQVFLGTDANMSGAGWELLLSKQWDVSFPNTLYASPVI